MNKSLSIPTPITPSLKALEAAALIAISEVIKDSVVKPSEQAVMMAARAMALKTLREIQSG
ncbi:hypothetical protein [Hydrogenophaga palleronii]|uniref:hypothetical protein n=1 Tax=Hydrogenophaga palleronii TaxID=65655 RepID=UPI0012EE52DE|nr:hypothetical protein [Hydrogenophaga palleronii]